MVPSEARTKYPAIQLAACFGLAEFLNQALSPAVSNKIIHGEKAIT